MSRAVDVFFEIFKGYKTMSHEDIKTNLRLLYQAGYNSGLRGRKKQSPIEDESAPLPLYRTGENN